MARVEQKAAFDFVRYASVWEDADILCEALQPAARGGSILSVASAGDNALALLTLDPDRVVAADLNPSQLACLELRMQAFGQLSYEEMLAFIGVDPSQERQKIYQKLRGKLSDQAKQFWDGHTEAITQGFCHAGKFERYLRTFGSKVIPWIHNAPTRKEILAPKTIEEQRQFYEAKWNNWRWRRLFQVFFSRFVMGRFGREPAFFDHVGGSVSDKILTRSKHAMTEIPTWSNPYMVYILTGNYSKAALPRYLRQEHFETIRKRIDRIHLHQGQIEEAWGAPFHGFNLSDIFEYMDESTHQQGYEKLLEIAAPGARLAYWNMLVPRACPKGCEERVKPLPEYGKELLQKDKAWFYQAFHVDEVCR